MTTEKAWERRKREQDAYLAANPYPGDPFARLPDADDNDPLEFLRHIPASSQDDVDMWADW